MLFGEHHPYDPAPLITDEATFMAYILGKAGLCNRDVRDSMVLYSRIFFYTAKPVCFGGFVQAY